MITNAQALSINENTGPASITGSATAEFTESTASEADNVIRTEFTGDKPRQFEDTISEKKIYGSFKLGTTEFALPVDSVQEVVNEPDAYSSVPLAPSYLLGLFNLRRMIVPVIDLKSIFGIESENLDCGETRKVAILEHGELCLGLRFDATGEVFNVADVEQCLFEKRQDVEREQVIKGVFKMDNGERIVQILDVCGMLKLDCIPHSSNHLEDNRFVRKRGARRQCISFIVGDSSCALDISAIKEIVNIGEIENKVLAGNLCLGAIDLRGVTVPIVNFSALLGYDDLPVDDMKASDSSRVIIMKIEENLVGLLVSRIENIISYFKDELIPFPVLNETKTDLFEGCITNSVNTDHNILLNHSKIFSNDEVLSITKGHSQLFADNETSQRGEKRLAQSRQTLLMFSMGNRYALDISEVKEVIDLPDDLIQAPNMPAHFCGMTNLRGELIAIIDSRKLYDLESQKSQSDLKVLVFEWDGEKQGLVVDSVDSIVPFVPKNSVSVPGIVYKGQHEDNISQDVAEAILVEHNGKEEAVCILNLVSVAERALRHAA